MLCCAVSCHESLVLVMLFINAQTATVPTPEETYSVSLDSFISLSCCDATYQAMAPDLRRKVDENRRARLALEEGMRRQQNAQVGFILHSVSYHTHLVP